MTEIKGFNEVAKRAEAIEKVKELNRRARKNRIADLVSQGIDRELAAIMVDTGCVKLFK